MFDFKGDFLMAALVVVVVAIAAGAILFSFMHKETCSVCGNQCAFGEVAAFNCDDNNVQFYLCSKCAWKAFEGAHRQ